MLIIPGIRNIAQETGNGTDTVYGFDPVLYNGRFYTYQVPRDTKGSPFLSVKGFEKGSISIFNKTYRNLDLNYDVYNQVLLLKYINHDGETLILELSDSWLNHFSIGSSDFELVQHTGTKPVICQFIESGSVKVQYFWKKELKLENVFGPPVYVFSDPKRENMILIHNRKRYYGKNKDFIKAFDPSIQVRISNFIKDNKIKVNKASDSVISGLVQFCNTQLNP